jgi:hypothetical protein
MDCCPPNGRSPRRRCKVVTVRRVSRRPLHRASSPARFSMGSGVPLEGRLLIGHRRIHPRLRAGRKRTHPTDELIKRREDNRWRLNAPLNVSIGRKSASAQDLSLSAHRKPASARGRATRDHFVPAICRVFARRLNTVKSLFSTHSALPCPFSLCARLLLLLLLPTARTANNKTDFNLLLGSVRPSVHGCCDLVPVSEPVVSQSSTILVVVDWVCSLFVVKHL